MFWNFLKATLGIYAAYFIVFWLLPGIGIFLLFLIYVLLLKWG